MKQILNMKTEKSTEEQIREMVDYEYENINSDYDGFSNLKRKVERNETYVNFILYITHRCFVKDCFFSIKEVSLNIHCDVDNTRKITDNFLSNNLLIRVKKGRKFLYNINKTEDRLKEFMQLFVISKAIKNGDLKKDDN